MDETGWLVICNGGEKAWTTHSGQALKLSGRNDTIYVLNHVFSVRGETMYCESIVDLRHKRISQVVSLSPF